MVRCSRPLLRNDRSLSGHRGGESAAAPLGAFTEAMAEYMFRLRFHLLDGDHIESDLEEIVLLEDERGRRLRLRSGGRGSPIKGHSKAALIGGPFPAETEAREAADRARRALLTWAIHEKLGIDVGDGKRRGGFTNHGKAHFAEMLGGPVRDDLHGIDVYENQEGLTFVGLSVKAALGKSADAFCSRVAAAFQEPTLISEKQALAAELYCSSFFDVSFRSRLITLVTALEALLTPAARPAAVIAAVASLEAVVQKAELDEATRSAMLGSLRWLRQESVGQAGRALVTSVLGQATYGGLEAVRFFTYLYDLRSQILHTGKPKDAQLDLLGVCNEAQRFVADLIVGPSQTSTA